MNLATLDEVHTLLSFMARFHRLGDRDPRKDFYINKAILLYRFSGFKNPKITISLYEFSEKG